MLHTGMRSAFFSCVVLSLPVFVLACSSEPAGGDGDVLGSGGASNASGGGPASSGGASTGGNTAGGSPNVGGTTNGVGGTEIASGGSELGAGGSQLGAGGAEPAAGGSEASGGDEGVGGSESGAGGGTMQALTGQCSSFANGSGTTQPCYLAGDGTAHCIADDGTTTELSGDFGTATNVTGKNFSTEACVVGDGGVVFCGQYPSMTSWISAGATQVSGAQAGHCALVSGAIQCDGIQPESPTLPSGQPTELTCFYDGCCAATDEGRMFCWGDPSPIGASSGEVAEVPLPDGKKLLQMGPGQDHICALVEGGQVQCWGEDWNAQLGGLGTNTTTGVTLVESGAISVTAGQFHTCVAFDDGTVQCVSTGQSEGAGLDMGILTEVSGIDDAIALNSGKHYTCALLSSNEIKCWGRIGGGTTPILVSGPAAAPCD